MKIKTLPTAAEIRALLAPLGHSQMRALASASGVPFTTLWKIRAGETTNPGIETVGKFAPHIPAAKLV